MHPKIHDETSMDLPLAISSEKVCFIIVKARELDAKEEPSVSDPGSNPTDDKIVSVLEDRADDAVFEELTVFIDSLSVDEQVDLVALTWLGRGDYTAEDWQAARRDAAAASNEKTANYLVGIPLLGDFLEEGLAIAGRSCEEFTLGRL
jgi:hypothetical protein